MIQLHVALDIISQILEKKHLSRMKYDECFSETGKEPQGSQMVISTETVEVGSLCRRRSDGHQHPVVWQQLCTGAVAVQVYESRDGQLNIGVPHPQRRWPSLVRVNDSQKKFRGSHSMECAALCVSHILREGGHHDNDEREQKKMAVCNHIMSFTCRARHYDEREQKKMAVCNHILSFTCRASHYARRGEKNR